MPRFSITPNDRVPFRLLLEDEHLAVADKPPWVVSQPGKGHDHDSLLNGLFARFGPALQRLGAARDFGLLHRLDREASGLVIVALRRESYDALRAAFASRRVRKFYWALALGEPRAPSGVIRKPLAETEDDQGRRVARILPPPRGKPSITAYRVLDASPRGTLLECRSVTGRLHQVRAHLAAIGLPIAGDSIYGPRSARAAGASGAAKTAPRLMLHAHRVVFTHPATGATIDVRSPLPADLSREIARRGLARPDPRTDAAELPELDPDQATRGDDARTP